jgi:hypothetical protein
VIGITLAGDYNVPVLRKNFTIGKEIGANPVLCRNCDGLRAGARYLLL